MKYIPVDRIIKHIGSILPQNKTYDRPSRALKALSDLSENGPALQFVHEKGWKKLMAEYQAQVNDLRQHILYLAQDTEKNKVEIQRTNDFMKAFELIINSTDMIVAKHSEAIKEHQKQTSNTALNRAAS